MVLIHRSSTVDRDQLRPRHGLEGQRLRVGGHGAGIRCTVQLFEGPGVSATPYTYDFAWIAGCWEVTG